MVTDAIYRAPFGTYVNLCLTSELFLLSFDSPAPLPMAGDLKTSGLRLLYFFPIFHCGLYFLKLFLTLKIFFCDEI